MRPEGSSGRTGRTATDDPTRASEDRVGLDPWVLGGLTAGVATLCAITAQILAAASSLGAGRTSVIGAALGAILLLLPRRVSIRLIARIVVVLSAVAQLRVAVLGDSLFSGSQSTLGWVVAALVVLVLTDVVATAATSPMRGWTPPDVRGPAAVRIAGTVAVIVLFVVLAAPLVLPLVSGSARTGEGPRLGAVAGGGSMLMASDSLDMTTRPDLDDEVVFTVDSNRGTFWRGQTYDAWDGRRWTQTEPERLPLAPGDRVVPSSDDLGASGSELVTQRVRMEAAYSDVVFAAASAVSVEANHAILQGADGTLATARGDAFGRGSGYTVTSRRPLLDEASLRAAPDEVPGHIAERYASMPVATDRVVAAARQATAGATNRYDQVRALERWMGERTEYSLDAPLSPVGVDVVDHFLFETRLGWCEQVASSLVVMARANGIPARLVTGFVPGEVDRVSGSYVVRGDDAHAWAEIWFAEVGWVSFDPTAEVPLAGSDPDQQSIGGWLLDHAVVLLVGSVVVAVLGFLVVRALRKLGALRADRPRGWAAVADARLVALGEKANWPRADCETASRFGRSLAVHIGDARLEEVGVAIDDALYAPQPPDEATRARVDHILDTAVARGDETGDRSGTGSDADQREPARTG